MKCRVMVSMSSKVRLLLDSGSKLLIICMCFCVVLSCPVQICNLLGAGYPSEESHRVTGSMFPNYETEQVRSSSL